MKSRHLLLLLLLAMVVTQGMTHSAFPAEDKAPSLQLIDPPPTLWVSPDTDKAGTTLILRNNTGTSVSGKLTVGDLRTNVGQEILPVKFTLTPDSVKDAPSPASFEVTVTNMLVDGEAEAPLRFGDTLLGPIKVVRRGLSLSLGGGAEQLFECGKKASLVLKNGTVHPQTVHWKIRIGSLAYCGNAGTDCSSVAKWSSVTVPPKNEATIDDIVLPAEWFPKLGDLVREDGALVLAPKTPDEVTNPDRIPKQTLQMRVRLRYPQTLWQSIIEGSCIFGILAAGGFCAMLLRHWLPNRRRMRELRDETSRLHGRIRSISSNVDSELRALVRVERRLIDNHLKSRWTLTPEYVAVADQCAQALKVLERRVDLTEEIDSLTQRLEGLWSKSLPPSRIDEIDDILGRASLVLKNMEPAEADFLTCQNHIKSATQLMEKIEGSDAEFSRELLERWKRLREEFKTEGISGKSTWERISARLPGARSLIAVPDLPADLPPDSYVSKDIALSSLELIKDYVRLAEGSPGLGERLKVDEERFLDLLSHESWVRLREATLLLRQMREGFYLGDIAKAVEDQQISITVDPPKPHPMELVHLSVRFRRQEFNWSAARECMTCVWKFTGGQTKEGDDDMLPDEHGWEIAYYFDKQADYQVSVTFELPDGNQVQGRSDPPGQNASTKSVSVRRPDFFIKGKWSRFGTELLGLAASLLVPMLGLLGAAQGEMDKGIAGGAIAVFLLGFGADTIKSVLVQRSGQQQP